LKKYITLSDTLTLDNGIVLKGEAIYIQKELRKEMLNGLHSAHLGYHSLVRRARNKIFWIGINQDIRQVANSRETC
jgi:regulatory protein YycI of two-component signal transduction system YycFG